MTTAVLCSLCLSCAVAAVAAPPLTQKIAASGRALPTEGIRGIEGRGAYSHGGSHERLDLRPPGTGDFAALSALRVHADMTSSPEAAAAYESKKFPSPHRGGAETDEDNSPPTGMAAGHARIMGRAEAFAQRFHREGLPVARLWESHSALISLGLNQKGKPGLWLVQKTH
jgi:hypothetical protein